MPLTLQLRIQPVVGKKAMGMYFVKLAHIKLVRDIPNVMIKNCSSDTPPNPPPSSGPAAPIQDDGTLEQPDNPNRVGSTNNPNTDNGILDSD